MNDLLGSSWIPTPEPENRAFWRDPFQIKQLNAWRKDLPKSDLLATARQLQEKINALNLIRTSTANRLRACQQLYRIHTQLLAQYDAVQQQPLLFEEMQILHQLLEQHLVALTQSHKIIIQQTAKRKTRNCRSAFTRCFQYLSALQRLSYLSHARLREQIWGEIHQLYAHARWLGFTDPFTLDSQDPLREQYIGILLFACCSPFQFNQGQLAAIHGALPHWAPLCSLHAGWSDGCLFMVRPSRPERPEYVSEEELIDQPDAGFLFFNTQPLAKHLLREHLNSPAPEPALRADNILDSTYTPLAAAWSRTPERQFPRFASNDQVRVQFGLAEFCQTLLAHKDKCPNDVADAKPQRPLEETAVWTQPPPQSEIQSAHVDWDRAPETVKLINSSALGVCLRMDSVHTSGTHVGEIVGVCDSSDIWQLATIRWQECRDDGTKTLLGLQLLGTEISPVTGKTTSLSDGCDIFGILIHERLSIREPPLLVLPGNGLEAGVELQLIIDKEPSRVVITQILSSNRFYCLFKFSTLY